MINFLINKFYEKILLGIFLFIGDTFSAKKDYQRITKKGISSRHAFLIICRIYD